MIRFSTLALTAALTAAGFAASAKAAVPTDDLSPLLALQDGTTPPPADDAPKHHRPKADAEVREGREGPGEHARERIMHALFEGITLDDAQKAALEKIHQENAEKREAFMKAHKDELKKFGDSVKAWHEAHKADFEAARKAVRDARESKDQDAAKKARENIKALLESRPKMPEDLKAGMLDPKKAEGQIRAILHPDQVAKFDANVKELEEKRKKYEDGGFLGSPGGPGERGGPGGGEGRPHHPHRGDKNGGKDGDKGGEAPPPPPAGDDK